MTATLALTKATRTGTATVHIEPQPGGGLATVARLDGRQIGAHIGPHHQATGLPAGYVAAIGRLPLTRAEADTVAAAYQRAQAAISPDLHAQRQHLVDTVAGAEEQWAADRARGLDEGWVDPHRHDARNEAEIGVARAELAAFDAAHPHIAAELAALQSAAANRAMHA